MYVYRAHASMKTCLPVLLCGKADVEGVWLVGGVKQPHLARVGLIGLGGVVGLHTCGA